MMKSNQPTFWGCTGAMGGERSVRCRDYLGKGGVRSAKEEAKDVKAKAPHHMDNQSILQCLMPMPKRKSVTEKKMSQYKHCSRHIQTGNNLNMTGNVLDRKGKRRDNQGDCDGLGGVYSRPTLGLARVKVSGGDHCESLVEVESNMRDTQYNSCSQQP